MCIRGAAERAGQLNPRAQDRTGGDKMRQVEMSGEKTREERRGVKRRRQEKVREERKEELRESLRWIRPEEIRVKN